VWAGQVSPTGHEIELSGGGLRTLVLRDRNGVRLVFETADRGRSVHVVTARDPEELKRSFPAVHTRYLQIVTAVEAAGDEEAVGSEFEPFDLVLPAAADPDPAPPRP
jgi:hypothetical protein